MVPAFRAGDFSGGISRAVDDIVMVLEGNAAELEARARAQPATHGAGDVDWIRRALHRRLGDALLRRLRDGDPAADLRPQDRARTATAGSAWTSLRSSGGSSGRGGGWSSGGSSGGGWSSAESSAAADFPAAAARRAAAAHRGAGRMTRRLMTPTGPRPHRRRDPRAPKPGRPARSTASSRAPATAISIPPPSSSPSAIAASPAWSSRSCSNSGGSACGCRSSSAAQLLALAGALALSARCPACASGWCRAACSYRRAHDNALKQFLARNVHLTSRAHRRADLRVAGGALCRGRRRQRHQRQGAAGHAGTRSSPT